MEGLKRLAKSDPLVLCFTAPTGEHIVAGAGELHLEICIKDLREDFMKGAPVIISDPVVSFQETVTMESTMTCVSKSPNKHNRIYLDAEQLDEKFVDAIEAGDVKEDGDKKMRGRMLADQFGWDIGEARKIWSFGMPPDCTANVLVDCTKGVQYLAEITDSMKNAFKQATCAGILCEEAMRGIRINLVDVVMHADAIHRGAGQIMPPTKRCIYACQFKSGPALMEPMYVCDITVPQNAVAGVYATLNQRRGMVEETIERPGTPLMKIKAFLPVLESFGFTNLLRANTSGQAFPQMIFSHWQAVNGDPLEEGSSSNKIIMDVRKRKGLKDTVPVFGDYYDKV
jgi:elongation factor 2